MSHLGVRSLEPGAVNGRLAEVTGSNDAARYRGFSCAHELFDDELLESAVTHYRRALRTFLSRHSAELERSGNGVVALCRSWLETPTRFTTIWHLAFAKMREVLVLRLPEQDVVEAAARLALRMCETGALGRFDLALQRPARFRWGRWLLPACDRLELVAREDGCELSMFHGSESRQLRLWRAERGEWEADGADPIAEVVHGPDRFNVFFPSTPEGFEHMEAELDADDTRQIWRALTQTFDVITEHAPVYLPWVRRVLRNLIPVKPHPGKYMGGASYRDNPGTVALSLAGSDPPVGLAANLVHECAHQHFHLVRTAGPLDDGSDDSLYFSPFVGEQRDIASILLTYQAFANEALLLRTCELSGLGDPHAGERAAMIRTTLAPLEVALSASPGLTPLGHALWRPVARHLAETYA
jgi:HEXXH motif-containing protein